MNINGWPIRWPENYSRMSFQEKDLSTPPEWIELVKIDEQYIESYKKNQAAYNIYSRFYSFGAVLALWLVWRGSVLKQAKYFAKTLQFYKDIVDIATGDGSLTKLALCSSFFTPHSVERLLCLEISSSMLKKATKKLGTEAILVRGCVQNLPFLNNSINCLTCFGGFNSFPNPAASLREMERVLVPGVGIIRGSVLLCPKKLWKQKLIQHWIDKGYQSTLIKKKDFFKWIEESQLILEDYSIVGDVMYFHLVKKEDNSNEC